MGACAALGVKSSATTTVDCEPPLPPEPPQPAAASASARATAAAARSFTGADSIPGRSGKRSRPDVVRECRRAFRLGCRAPMRRLVQLMAAVILVGGTVAVAQASAATPGRPTDRDQPVRDGCQRPNFANLTLVNSPEWVYVNRAPSIRFARGVSRVSPPASVDQPGTHDWYDLNSNLVPDKPYRYLIAGRKGA